MSGINWKFALEAKPYWLFAPAAFFVVALIFGAGKVEERASIIPSGVPIVGATDGEVREIFITPTPTPIAVITEGPSPTVTPPPTSTAAPPTAPPQQVEGAVQSTSIIVEAVDLSAILDAIANIDLNVAHEDVDTDALIAAIEASLNSIVIEVTVDGTTETFVCDTRGRDCEEPPFGN